MNIQRIGKIVLILIATSYVIGVVWWLLSLFILHPPTNEYLSVIDLFVMALLWPLLPFFVIS